MYTHLHSENLTIGDGLTIEIPAEATRSIITLEALGGAAFYEAMEKAPPTAQFKQGEKGSDLKPLDPVIVDTAPGETRTLTISGTPDAVVVVAHYAAPADPAEPGAALNPPPIGETVEADHG